VLDRVARDGIRFDRAVSPVPLTLPAHATILTGLLPPHHTVRNNGSGKLPEDVPTLATLLGRNGYRTGAFVGAFVLDRRFGLSRGFDVYNDDIASARKADATLEAERPAEEVAAGAVEWLKKTDSKPFFAWVHFYDPHAPYGAPEPFGKSFAQNPYDGEIAYVDTQVGRLLAELDRQGVADHTIVLIVGDHGEALGEHGELTHGVLLYEPTLRVPMIIRAPGLLEPGAVAHTVSLADIEPTLASLLVGHRSSDTRLGTDLSPFLRDRKEPPQKIVYSETQYPTLFGWSGLAATRQENLKYIDSPEPELYDLSEDPGETTNLYGKERRAMRPLANAARTIAGASPASRPSPLDPETERKLASLGYVAPSGQPAGGRQENPAQMIGLFRRFEQAMWDLTAGKADQAIAELEVLTTADPENPVFRSALARALRQHGQIRRAIAMYREAVALRPDDAEGWYNLAVAFQEAGDQKHAAEAVREAIERDPSRPEAHNVLGIAFSAEGRLMEALDQFREAARLDPRNARAANNAGNVYRSMQKWGDAEASYRQAAELDPAYSDPWNGLGTVQVERGKPREAIQYFDRALQLSAAAHEARLNRAVAYQLAGEVDAAIREYRAFIAAVRNDPAFDQQRRGAEQMVARLSRSTS
jgi:arylsulfatase A-like enzyme/Tfp pilus assembly protein PilF